MKAPSHILIVDDHQLFLEGMRQLLLHAYPDVQIVTAKSAATALQVIDQQSDLDLVLLDINLPDMDGLALMSAMTVRDVSIPVVVISANENLNLIRLAISAGALGYIPKSGSSEQMLDAIARVLAGDLYLPRNLQLQFVANDSAPAQADDHVKARLKQLNLSERQYEVLMLLAMGHKNAKIAEVLHITEATIKAHVSALLKGLNAANRTECVLVAKRQGLLPQLDL